MSLSKQGSRRCARDDDDGMTTDLAISSDAAAL